MRSDSSAGFPPELLEQGAAACQHYFDTEVIVVHKRFREAHRRVMEAIQHPAGSTLLYIYGPSGVGTTAVLRSVAAKLNEQAEQDQHWDRGRIPVVMVGAAAPEAGVYNWKDHFTRGLEAIAEPLIQEKIAYEAQHDLSSEIPRFHRTPSGHLTIEHAKSAPDFRRVLEKLLAYRRPYAFVIDDAQYLAKTGSGRRWQDHIDALASMAKSAHTVHVLVGNYDLLVLSNLTAHLGVQTTEIEFARYIAREQSDRQEFQRVLQTFQQYLPVHETPDLLSHWDHFYEGTLGCVGLLHNWLSAALRDALTEHSESMLPQHWEPHRLPERTLAKLMEEIKTGARILTLDKDTRQKLTTFTALDIEMELGAGASAASQKAGASAASDGTTGKKTSKRRPGRSPHRDPVGRQHEVSADAV